MKILKTLPFVIAAFCSLSSYADETDTAKLHTFGAQWGVGGADFGNSNTDGDGVLQLYGYYNYAFNQNLALELGLNVGADVDDWDCHQDSDDDWHCNSNNSSLFDLDADEVTYSNFVVAIKGTFPLSKRNSLYGKIGGQSYDYEISKRDRVVIDDSGIGAFVEAGWQYRWDFGLGLNAGFQHMNMGDLDTSVLTAGVSYNF